MKVSIDGILGSARRINNQRQVDEDNLNKKKKEVKSDSITIGSKINSRLDTIETELREIQTSLTRNQIVRDGIEQLRSDMERGGKNQEQILSSVTFNGEAVLRDMFPEPVTEQSLGDIMTTVNESITTDATSLKRLQVEVDNIMASNLAGSEKADSLMNNINSVTAGIDGATLESISRLSPDAVMKLIR